MAMPLYLYIHIPFCVRKCPYCDFNSHAVEGRPPEDAYVDALLRDLAFAVEHAPQRRPVEGVFFGGGTPSVFSAAAIARVLEAVDTHLALTPDAEITLEANPGTAEQARFSGYRDAGVNRLSLGIQSFDSGLLTRLGRIHDGDEAVRAVHWAHDAGFDNINLDLMFALPDQTLEQARADVEQACSLAPAHISYYQLTLEPGTAFFHQPPRLPEEDEAWRIQSEGQAILAARGYEQYEVSAYARGGRQCRHNLNYWRFGDYLAIGAGAHSKITTDEATGNIVREARARLPRRYLQNAGSADVIAQRRSLDRDDRIAEFALNALRLREGFELNAFTRATGLAASELDAPLTRARQLGLIDEDGGRVRASDLGWRHLNTLVEQFL